LEYSVVADDMRQSHISMQFAGGRQDAQQQKGGLPAFHSIVLWKADGAVSG